MHFITSLGSAVTPLVVDLFTTYSFQIDPESSANNLKLPDSFENISILENVQNLSGNWSEFGKFDEENYDVFWDVFYSYTTVAVVMVLAGFAFFTALVFTQNPSKSLELSENKFEKSFDR